MVENYRTGLSWKVMRRWSLVDPEMKRRHPPPHGARGHFECLIEGRFEPIACLRTQVHLRHRANGGDHDLRCERERRQHHPWRYRAVVRAVGRSTFTRRFSKPGPSVAVIPQRCSP
jgi:hypothetical protein